MTMDDQKRSQVLSDDPQSETETFYIGPDESDAIIEQFPDKSVHPRETRILHASLLPAIRQHFTHARPGQGKQTGSPAKRKLLIGGVVGSLLLLIAATSLVVYRYSAIQTDITAYKVGAQQNVTQYIGGGGVAFPRQQFDLSYPVSARAMNVLVKAGDHVKPNQALIKLDLTQINIQITQAANNLSAAQTYLNSVANAFPYSGVAVAAAQQEVQVAQNRYNALVAQTSSATMRNGSLISPMQGVVTVVNVNPGETFAANNVLLTVMDQSSITVRAKIPLENLGQISVGMPAQVTPSALPNSNIQGKVSSVITQADPQTDTFQVWIDVPNTQQMLLPGMSAFVRVQGQQNAFVLPRLAVLNPDHESSVFIVRKGHAYITGVHVAGRSETSVFVDSGIQAGDTIVLLPADKILRDAQPVNITKVES